MNINPEEIKEALKHVMYPAAGKNIIDLDMVSDLRINGLQVSFVLVFDRVKDPMENSVKKACEKALKYYIHPDIILDIQIKNQSVPVNTSSVPVAKNIIAIASGKGGVGKSTVAVNLSVALAKKGLKVGLLDADIYGPSVPKMLNVEKVQPQVAGEKGQERILPVTCCGIKVLSIGFFIHPDDALIWRGPMATSALKQLLYQGEWGELDYLLIDLPPGTGDIHLTIVQELPVSGAVIVSTPQQVALSDVIKGINMFRNDKVNVPVLGIIENMAWFTPAEHPDKRYYIFGKEGCKELAERENIKLLGQIPLVQSICESGDNGSPESLDDSSVTGKAFMDLAGHLIKEIGQNNTAPVNI